MNLRRDTDFGAVNHFTGVETILRNCAAGGIKRLALTQTLELDVFDVSPRSTGIYDFGTVGVRPAAAT